MMNPRKIPGEDVRVMAWREKLVWTGINMLNTYHFFSHGLPFMVYEMLRDHYFGPHWVLVHNGCRWLPGRKAAMDIIAGDLLGVATPCRDGSRLALTNGGFWLCEEFLFGSLRSKDGREGAQLRRATYDRAIEHYRHATHRHRKELDAAGRDPWPRYQAQWEAREAARRKTLEDIKAGRDTDPRDLDRVL